ncbi:MAG: glycosyltransferase family 4 protein [bacterium]|nr:glycosyltransferase family 4 protein [bacterium]
MKLIFVTQVIDGDDAVLGFVVRWVRGLAAVCERVRVLALEAGDISELPANVDVRVIGREGRIARYLRYQRFLREAFDEDGFGTILTHMVPRYSLVAARAAKRAGARHFLWYTHKGVDGRLRRAVDRVEKVFTASAESMRVATDKKVVSGHGIDLAHFELDAPPQEPARLLSVGRLSPSKDPLTIFGALERLLGEGRELHLDWVGGGLTESDEEFRVAVEERVRGPLAGHVHLHGSIPYRDIPRFYRDATMFVSASRTGSVDKVVLEAMATRRPVVTCNESFPAIFAELGDEAHALEFPTGDAAELAARIGALLDRGQAGRDELGGKLRAIVARDHEVDALMTYLVREMGGEFDLAEELVPMNPNVPVQPDVPPGGGGA